MRLKNALTDGRPGVEVHEQRVATLRRRCLPVVDVSLSGGCVTPCTDVTDANFSASSAESAPPWANRGPS